MRAKSKVPSLLHLPRGLEERAVGGARERRAQAHPLHAQACEHVERERRSRQAHDDVHWLGRHRTNDRVDFLTRLQAGRVQNVSPRLGKGGEAPNRVRQVRASVDQVLRPGGEHERKWQRPCRLHRGLDALDGQIVSDRCGSPARPVASSMDPPTSPTAAACRMVSAQVSGSSPNPFSRSAETGNEVASTIARGVRKRFLATDRAFGVGPADGECKSGTRRCQRLESQCREHAGRPRVPGIGNRENPGPVVKGSEGFSACRLGIHHTDSSTRTRDSEGRTSGFQRTRANSPAAAWPPTRSGTRPRPRPPRCAPTRADIGQRRIKAALIQIRLA